MVVVILVHLLVQLKSVSSTRKKRQVSYEVQHRNLHHALIEVRGSIFDNFDRDNLARLEVLTFHNLPKGSLSENIEDKVAVPGCG
jgi:hypothetical protein